MPFNPSSGKPTLVCLMRTLVTSDYSYVTPSVITSFIPVGPTAVLPASTPAGTEEVNLYLGWPQQTADAQHL